jgi:site-specific DNA recombinase
MVSSAAIYCRISKDGDGLRAGVDRQAQDGRALAERKGWPVGEVFVDNDLSAWSGKRRPEYERMLEAIRASTVDAVIVWHLDRLTRTPRELEEFFDVCDAARLTRMATVTGDIDLGTRDGRLQARILGAVARKSSDDASARIRRAFDEKAANGLWKRGGLRPFGYVWSDDAGTIVPYQPEAELVREAARRVLAGESRRAITLDWDARGLTTSQGKPWSITRLADVLRSPTLVAKRIHRDEVVGDGTWEPILAIDTWAAVDRKLRRTRSGARPGRQRHLLTGIIVCGECGRRMSAKSRPNREGEGRRTYACVSDSAKSCGKVRVIAGPVERLVLDQAWEWLEPDQIVDADATISETPAETAMNDRLAELDEYEAELAAARRGGTITGTVFLRELQAVKDERDDVARQRAKLQNPVEGIVVTPEQKLMLAGPPDTLAGAPSDVVEFWRGVVGAVFEQVIIKRAGKGRRFSPDRVQLIPREGYEGVVWPDPKRASGREPNTRRTVGERRI